MLLIIFALQILIQQQVSANFDCNVKCFYLTLFFRKELHYRVVIFPSKKSGPTTTSANVWVAISGSMGETQQVSIPRSSLEFVFHVSSPSMS